MWKLPQNYLMILTKNMYNSLCKLFLLHMIWWPLFIQYKVFIHVPHVKSKCTWNLVEHCERCSSVLFLFFSCHREAKKVTSMYIINIVLFRSKKLNSWQLRLMGIFLAGLPSPCSMLHLSHPHFNQITCPKKKQQHKTLLHWRTLREGRFF